MRPDSNQNKPFQKKDKTMRIQTFLVAMDQHPQWVHREAITWAVEEVHRLMIRDVVDHHFENKKNQSERLIQMEEIP